MIDDSTLNHRKTGKYLFKKTGYILNNCDAEELDDNSNKWIAKEPREFNIKKGALQSIEWPIILLISQLISYIQNWTTAIKMLFDYLRKIFGWCDESTRKRQATALDIDDYDYINPKKVCREHNNMHNNHRDVIEIEDDVDVEELYEDHSFSRCNNNVNNSLRKRNNNTYCNNHQPKQPVNNHVAKKNYLSNTFPGKSRLNSRPSTPPRYSALSKTHQLREKEQYGQMLQNFLPRIQVIPSSPERARTQKPVEVISLDEPSTSKADVFSTPMCKTPSRWFTPMSRLAKSTPLTRGKPIEVIKLDDSDDGAAAAKPKPESIKKLNIKREIVHTNSLRDRLSGKDVMKMDFIPRVAERYNDRFEKKVKEAEELKKMTSVLAKHNRMQREVALEEQLAKSMRLWEAVLEEEEEEEEPSLPELNDQMVAEVQAALVPRPPDEALVDAFGLKITRKDINTLAGLNWLNDEVINFYMNLLIQRGNEEKYPSVYAMNTFFYPKLISSGHSALKRWTRKVDIFAQDIVVVPVHLRMHWCMSIIDFRDKSIRYYDSMGGDNQKCLQALKKYLEDESLDKKKKVYDTSDWTLECMSDIPQQMNGSDCGVFSCTFAEFICANRKITFSQDDMPYFRSKMVYEILKAKLL